MEQTVFLPNEFMRDTAPTGARHRRLATIFLLAFTLLCSAAQAITLTAVQSRKTHGAIGDFNITIDTTKNISADVTIEPRAIGAGHQIVFQFNAPPLASSTASVTAVNEVGISVGTATAVQTGNDIVVTLAGIPDQQRLRISLQNVDAGGLDVSASIGFLLGDVDGNGVVNTDDLTQVRTRAGQAATADNNGIAGNFRYDLNATGVVSAADISAVRAHNTRSLLSTVRTLTIGKSGLGTISSTPAGINCGPDCSKAFPVGTAVTLDAIADTGWDFAGWSGACSGTGACVVTMDAAKNISAQFTVQLFTANISLNGGGTGVVTSSPPGIACGASCSGTFPYGTPVTLTPTASPDSIFIGWAGGCSGNSTCVLNMIAPQAVVATFELLPPGNAVFVSPNGSDGAAGTVQDPMRTVTNAIAMAVSRGVPQVYATSGLYNETVQLASNVSVAGGYDPQTWQRLGVPTIIRGSPQGILSNGALNVTLSHLNIEGSALPGSGESAYGIRAFNGTTLTLDAVSLIALNGNPGTPGSRGSDGLSGGDGGNGGPGDCDIGTAGGAGGAAGIGRGVGALAGRNGGAGGAGGNTGTNSGQTGGVGVGGASGGNGGSGGSVGGPGGTGATPSNALAGSKGTGGNGGFVLSVWTGTKGGNGGNGTPGAGGGGGGGGGGQGCTFCDNGPGNGGGGGGAGGSAGTGGTGGDAGGGSFGLYVLNAFVNFVSASTISAGNGGAGGAGGAAGIGGPGGLKGLGATTCPAEVGTGGNGGVGGKGGDGGAGGGGAGGPSAGIYRSSGTVTGTVLTTISHGSGGAGGGASNGNAGVPGAAGNIF